MNEVLEAINTVLASLLNTTKIQVIGIHSDAEFVALATQNRLPAISISPVGEDTEVGPMGEMFTRIYKIKVRILYRTIDFNNARTGTDNIFAISLKVEELLYSDKKLGGKVDQMNDNFKAEDFNFVAPENNRALFIGRDIFIEYKKFLPWTGKENNQPSLSKTDYESMPDTF